MGTSEYRVAGDFDYEAKGAGYARQRQTDPRIAAYIHEAIGAGATLLNVGAGAGSYEPTDRYVLAIEPAAAMRAQRPRHLTPAVHGIAEALPLDDQSFDASMATVTIHQWSDWPTGIREMKRVTRGPIVLLVFDGDALDRFWLADYCPEIIVAEQKRDPAISDICDVLGGEVEVKSIPIPIDCVDGFTEAFYARPELMLEPAVRRAQSAWGFVEEGVEERFARLLGDDLASGVWDKKYGHLRTEPFFDGSLRLIVSRPNGRTHS
jgi:SAM-dependent methyltransferase